MYYYLLMNRPYYYYYYYYYYSISFLICQMLAKSSEVESERTERKFLCIVHLLYKVVA